MAGIEKSGDKNPITHGQKEAYKQEYGRALDLFQNALNQYTKSDNMFQQQEFHNVMDKALNVLNETAQELQRKELLKQNEKIEQDYAAFNNTPSDSRLADQLSQDLKQAKKTIG